jgi:hypothetical protein
LLPEAQVFRNTGRPAVAFSPDGRHFVYNTSRGLFLRSMDSLTARVIPGTEETLTNPFISPDGEWVGYYNVGAQGLRKIAIAGGAPATIGPASNPYGATWGTERFYSPNLRASCGFQNGGTPELILRPKRTNRLMVRRCCPTVRPPFHIN